MPHRHQLSVVITTNCTNAEQRRKKDKTKIYNRTRRTKQKREKETTVAKNKKIYLKINKNK